MAESAKVAIFDQYRDRLDIRTPGWKQKVGTLSGGKRQKIVIGKWLPTHPEGLIVAEPTRGTDVGSKSEILKLPRDQVAAGRPDIWAAPPDRAPVIVP
ncbi:hypothetical protein [Tropicibacter sp. S64]|uniref:hypothetical protein n=1 Tax=Tropicibacter sp. S64 TaxID=3415122 RepID=UPI003C7EA019